jgi:hypothetical protein
MAESRERWRWEARLKPAKNWCEDPLHHRLKAGGKQPQKLTAFFNRHCKDV